MQCCGCNGIDLLFAAGWDIAINFVRIEKYSFKLIDFIHWLNYNFLIKTENIIMDEMAKIIAG